MRPRPSVVISVLSLWPLCWIIGIKRMLRMANSWGIDAVQLLPIRGLQIFEAVLPIPFGEGPWWGPAPGPRTWIDRVIFQGQSRCQDFMQNLRRAGVQIIGSRFDEDCDFVELSPDVFAKLGLEQAIAESNRSGRKLILDSRHFTEAMRLMQPDISDEAIIAKAWEMVSTGCIGVMHYQIRHAFGQSPADYLWLGMAQFLFHSQKISVVLELALQRYGSFNPWQLRATIRYLASYIKAARPILDPVKHPATQASRCLIGAPRFSRGAASFS